MREQREKTPHTGLSQMGTCLPQADTRSVWGKISADFLGLCEQSLNGERDPGTHRWTNSSQEAPLAMVKGGCALHRCHSQSPRTQRTQRRGSGDS